MLYTALMKYGNMYDFVKKICRLIVHCTASIEKSSLLSLASTGIGFYSMILWTYQIWNFFEVSAGTIHWNHSTLLLNLNLAKITIFTHNKNESWVQFCQRNWPISDKITFCGIWIAWTYKVVIMDWFFIRFFAGGGSYPNDTDTGTN